MPDTVYSRREQVHRDWVTSHQQHIRNARESGELNEQRIRHAHEVFLAEMEGKRAGTVPEWKWVNPVKRKRV